MGRRQVDGNYGFLVAGVVTMLSAVVTFLLQGKKKWELEVFKTGNTELREQAATHFQTLAELKSEAGELRARVSSQDILISELKGMAQQIPAITELSQQQHKQHTEVTAILGQVAKGLTDLINEFRKSSKDGQKRRSDTAS